MAKTRPRIDDAAFGVMYGSIAVMAQLMIVHPPIDNPGRQAVILFGSVFAMALAKAVAEICERMLETGKAARGEDFAHAWGHRQTVLIAANGPTLAFVLAAVDVISPETALVAAQGLVVILLGWFGGRIGWRVGGTLWSATLAAIVTSAIAASVSLIKTMMH